MRRMALFVAMTLGVALAGCEREAAEPAGDAAPAPERGAAGGNGAGEGPAIVEGERGAGERLEEAAERVRGERERAGEEAARRAEEAADRAAEELDELAEVLRGIEDRMDAIAASPRVKELVDRVREAGRELEGMSPEARQEAEEVYRERLAPVVSEVRGEVERLVEQLDVDRLEEQLRRLPFIGDGGGDAGGDGGG